MPNSVMINRQLILFISVGCACAAIDVSSMKLLILLGSHYGVAVSVGFFVGLVANYIFHARVTFKAISSVASIVKFLIVALINYIITLVFVFIFLKLMDSVMIGKLISLPVIAANGFLLSRYWVFR